MHLKFPFKLQKNHFPTFEEGTFPITKGCFMSSSVETGQVVLEEIILKVFNEFLLPVFQTR